MTKAALSQIGSAIIEYRMLRCIGIYTARTKVGEETPLLQAEEVRSRCI
jgi:hypothetical protein